MTWHIEWYKKAAKNLESLPKEIRDRVVKYIDKVQQAQFNFLEHFELKGYYKIRVGDYRAIASVDFQNKIISIHIFDHRKRIYKRL